MSGMAQGARPGQAEARERYLSRHSPEARQGAAEAARSARRARTPQQQLELLDKKLGKGQGAVRERARLQKQIDDLAAPPKKKTKT